MASLKKYKVNEIFYSLQGEGYYAGTPAIFVRFSGCNLACPFCDTDFKAYTEMTEWEIVDKVRDLSKDAPLVVFTGGEPALQLTPYLIESLHNEGYTVAVETNGTKELPYNVDWVTVSPKAAFIEGDVAKPTIDFASEIKVVFDGKHEVSDYGIGVQYHFLQPCDTGDPERNQEIVNQCVEYIKAHPHWRLSLQTQKIIGVR